MSLYTLLLLGAISVPLTLSFDKKLQFYKQWKYLIPAIGIVATVYLFFDYLFTIQGFWGFNSAHHSSCLWYGLPIEEWLFFFVIPYASIFLHDSILVYHNQLKLNVNTTRLITLTIIGLSVMVLAYNFEKSYTVYAFIKMIMVLSLSIFDKSQIISRFYITFLFILVPFVIINGILTGSCINEPVVWYNRQEHLGIRVLTIPLEDFAYAFSLIAFVLFLRGQLRKLY